MLPVRFSAALLKVASRCNLDCDYCYVYHHEDQSWRTQPHLMSLDTIRKVAARIREYTEARSLKEFTVTFHGGEPLLFGAERLAEAAALIRSAANPECALDFSLQTNGSLLTDEAIDILDTQEILLSLSLDGYRELNDRHRIDHAGESSFDATFSAVQRLRQRKPKLFQGVIAVIDPYSNPRHLFDFFASLQVPRLDLLLPDATHLRLPAGRTTDPQLYSTWLNAAFEVWFREYPSLPVRWFDALLATRLGVASPTDAMGLGSINLIVIDTNGGYTDHDVFKITQPGPSLNCNVEVASFMDLETHPSIQKHAFHLTLEGLASECKTCPVVAGCGGGSVMHRWHQTRKLDAPSVYCNELFSIFEVATKALRTSLDADSGVCEHADVPIGGADLLTACGRWRDRTELRANEFCRHRGLIRNEDSAASILLRANPRMKPDADVRRTTAMGRWLEGIRIHAVDPWLIAPFSDALRVCERDSFDAEQIFVRLSQAQELITAFDPVLPKAFATLISDVVFVESKLESADRIFSLSDDSAPNVIYLSIRSNGQILEPEDLADSLMHEFFHHVLYHAEEDGRMLHDKVFPKFPAPWRPSSDLRPAGGFLHGTFVFSALARFWRFLARYDRFRDSEKAAENATQFHAWASHGISSLRQFALLTHRGRALTDRLSSSLGIIADGIRAAEVEYN